MEKHREKAWDQNYVMDRKWWTRLVQTESTISGPWSWRSFDPRPSPNFSPWLRDFLHGYKIKSGRGLGTRLFFCQGSVGMLSSLTTSFSAEEAAFPQHGRFGHPHPELRTARRRTEGLNCSLNTTLVYSDIYIYIVLQVCITKCFHCHIIYMIVISFFWFIAINKEYYSLSHWSLFNPNVV